MSIMSSIRARVTEHQMVSRANAKYKLKHKQLEEQRVIRESEKANADRKIAEARKYGTGIGGAIAKAKEGFAEKKKAKAKASLGIHKVQQGSSGIQMGVNRSAFELGSGGTNATSPFSLGSGTGDKSFLELGNKKKKE